MGAPLRSACLLSDRTLLLLLARKPGTLEVGALSLQRLDEPARLATAPASDAARAADGAADSAAGDHVARPSPLSHISPAGVPLILPVAGEPCGFALLLKTSPSAGGTAARDDELIAYLGEASPDQSPTFTAPAQPYRVLTPVTRNANGTSPGGACAWPSFVRVLSATAPQLIVELVLAQASLEELSRS